MRRKKFERLQEEYFRLEMFIEDYAMPRLLKGGKKMGLILPSSLPVLNRRKNAYIRGI